jgi:hypothetical protein
LKSPWPGEHFPDRENISPCRGINGRGGGFVS